MDSRGGGKPSLRPAEHDFAERHRCTICGAPSDLERGRNRENYAYSFIHGAYPTKEMGDMKFDVIVGNPPYQIGTKDAEGYGRATASRVPPFRRSGHPARPTVSC